jgi:hypothetical protein
VFEDEGFRVDLGLGVRVVDCGGLIPKRCCDRWKRDFGSRSSAHSSNSTSIINSASPIFPDNCFSNSSSVIASLYTQVRTKLFLRIRVG